MKKTYQKPAALVVRVVTGNLLQSLSLPKTAVGAQNRGLTKRMYEIEVE